METTPHADAEVFTAEDRGWGEEGSWVLPWTEDPQTRMKEKTRRSLLPMGTCRILPSSAPHASPLITKCCWVLSPSLLDRGSKTSDPAQEHTSRFPEQIERDPHQHPERRRKKKTVKKKTQLFIPMMKHQTLPEAFVLVCFFFPPKSYAVCHLYANSFFFFNKKFFPSKELNQHSEHPFPFLASGNDLNSGGLRLAGQGARCDKLIPHRTSKRSRSVA